MTDEILPDAISAARAVISAWPPACTRDRPWYREPDGRREFRWDSCSEFERLLDAAGKAGVPIRPLAHAAEMLADRIGCPIAEAWDRLAFNLERIVDGRRGCKGCRVLFQPTHWQQRYCTRVCACRHASRRHYAAKRESSAA